MLHAHAGLRDVMCTHGYMHTCLCLNILYGCSDVNYAVVWDGVLRDPAWWLTARGTPGVAAELVDVVSITGTWGLEGGG